MGCFIFNINTTHAISIILIIIDIIRELYNTGIIDIAYIIFETDLTQINHNLKIIKKSIENIIANFN